MILCDIDIQFKFYRRDKAKGLRTFPITWAKKAKCVCEFTKSNTEGQILVYLYNENTGGGDSAVKNSVVSEDPSPDHTAHIWLLTTAFNCSTGGSKPLFSKGSYSCVHPSTDTYAYTQ